MDKKLFEALFDYINEGKTDDSNLYIISEWMANTEADLHSLNSNEYDYQKSEYFDKLSMKECRERSFKRIEITEKLKYIKKTSQCPIIN